MITDTINTMDTVTIPGKEGGVTRQQSANIYINTPVTQKVIFPVPSDIIESYRYVYPSLWGWLH